MANTTFGLRVSLDLQLQHAVNAEGIIDIADHIEKLVVAHCPDVVTASWNESVATEPNFDYSDWNRLMTQRAEARRGA